MINKIAHYIAEVLCGPVANSGVYPNFTEKQIRQIISFDIIAKLRKIVWMLLLFVLSSMIFLLGIDIRIQTLIIFCIVVTFRNKFGGYHNDSPIACLMISTIITIVLALISISIKLNIYIITAIYFFAYLTVKFKGVVDHPNRRFEKGNRILNLEMKNRLLKVGFIFLLIAHSINMIVFTNGYVNLSNAIALGIFISFFSLYFGK